MDSSTSSASPEGATLQIGLALATTFRVFPVHGVEDGACTCGRTCGDPGKHPRVTGWQRAATRRESTIRTWSGRWPGTNWGIACGAGLLVLDEDDMGRFAGACHERGWTIPETLTVTSGRVGGGRHHYFKCPPWLTLPNRRFPDLGVDIRCTGGYVVAPGSRHASGAIYDYATIAAMADAPAWLLALAQEEPASVPAPRTERAVPVAPPVSTVPVSARLRALLDSDPASPRWATRSEAVWSAELALIQAGLDDAAVVDLLMAAPVGERARRSGRSWLLADLDRARDFVRQPRARMPATEEVRAAIASAGLKPGPVKVVSAMATICEAQGGGRFTTSLRAIALDAEMSVGTVHKWITRLQDMGWVRREAGTATRASTYILTVPITLDSHSANIGGSKGGGGGGGTEEGGVRGVRKCRSAPLPTAEDALRWGALATQATTLTVLLDQPERTWTVAQLVEVTGRSQPTVYRDLRRLREAGIVAEGRIVLTEGWADRLPEVARHYGTAGRNERDVARYKHEDELHRKALADLREDRERREREERDLHLRVQKGLSGVDVDERVRRSERMSALLGLGYQADDIHDHLVDGVALPSHTAGGDRTGETR